MRSHPSYPRRGLRFAALRAVVLAARGCFSDCQTLFLIGIVHNFAFVVEDHRRALVGIERCPVRNALVVRVSGFCECYPCRAHLVGEWLAVLAFTEFGL